MLILCFYRVIETRSLTNQRAYFLLITLTVFKTAKYLLSISIIKSQQRNEKKSVEPADLIIRHFSPLKIKKLFLEVRTCVRAYMVATPLHAFAFFLYFSLETTRVKTFNFSDVATNIFRVFNFFFSYLNTEKFHTIFHEQPNKYLTNNLLEMGHSLYLKYQ